MISFYLYDFIHHFISKLKIALNGMAAFLDPYDNEDDGIDKYEGDYRHDNISGFYDIDARISEIDFHHHD